MSKFLKSFARKEDGAVTVDYVVLCAAVVGLAFVVIPALSTALKGTAESVGTSISTQVTNNTPPKPD
jgi:Flp pilus assembly pilin Flp